MLVFFNVIAVAVIIADLNIVVTSEGRAARYRTETPIYAPIN